MVISLAEGAPEGNTDRLRARCPESVIPGHTAMWFPASGLGRKDAMKPKDAASISFAWFNGDQKERGRMTQSLEMVRGFDTAR